MRILPLLCGLLSLICVSRGVIIREQQNQYRDRWCGKSVHPNSLHAGTHNTPTVQHSRTESVSINTSTEPLFIDGKDAPWIGLVVFDNKKYGSRDYATGFLISHRHILTTSAVVIDGFGNWTSLGKRADMRTCQERSMEHPLLEDKTISFTLCDKVRAGQTCSERQQWNVKKATYIGNCDENMDPFGMALLEVDKELDPLRYNALCVPYTPTTNVRVKVEVYGLGPFDNRNPYDAMREPRLGAMNATVSSTCKSDYAFGEYFVRDLSICLESSTVRKGDGGGPIVRGTSKKTAIGVIRDEYNSNHVSVAAFSKEICKLSGICDPKNYRIVHGKGRGDL